MTENAASVLHETLETAANSENDVFRLIETEEGIGLDLGEEGMDDQLVQYGERTVLVVDPELAESLAGTTLDVQETPEGRHLILLGLEDA